ncbi:hypothetical protein HHL14_13900 [Paraburkholderia sp. G-4-1-8]|uniref:Lipoprotein SmpA/OmlA domain-containing protein n=1 Tax=Paraburkholderia antibiotica TaxID=2728839 RepID=A0A7X9ZXK0_9BURK|nr:hypothetical protein [Paraburkholderia antibiotica]
MLAAALLAGCAQPWTAFQPGEDASLLATRLGKPAETYSLPDGGKRLMWPTQPLGYTTIAADVSADGKIESVRQVLQPDEFNQAQVGAWTKQDVLVHFGRPAATKAMPRLNEEVWSYRYRDSGTWQLLYNFYFDQSGVLRLTQQSPDPLRQTGNTLY